MSAGSSASFERWGKSVVELEAGTHIDPSQGGPARTSRDAGTAADTAALLHFHHTSSPEPPEVTQRSHGVTQKSHSSRPPPDQLQASLTDAFYSPKCSDSHQSLVGQSGLTGPTMELKQPLKQIFIVLSDFFF